MITIFTVVGFVFFAALLVAAAIFAAQKAKEKREQVLLAVGFQPCESKAEKNEMGEKLQFVNPRHRGKRLVMSLYRRPLEEAGLQAYFCMYHFSGASGRTSGGEWSLVILSAPRLSLPHILLERVPNPDGPMGRLYKTLAKNFPPGSLLKRESADPLMAIFVDPAVKDFTVVDSLALALSEGSNSFNLEARGDLLVLSEPMGPGARGLEGSRLQRQVQVLRKLFQVASEAGR